MELHQISTAEDLTRITRRLLRDTILLLPTTLNLLITPEVGHPTILDPLIIQEVDSPSPRIILSNSSTEWEEEEETITIPLRTITTLEDSVNLPLLLNNTSNKASVDLLKAPSPVRDINNNLLLDLITETKEDIPGIKGATEVETTIRALGCR